MFGNKDEFTHTFTNAIVCSIAFTLTQLFPLLLIYTHTHYLTRSLARLPTQLLIHSFTHSFTHSPHSGTHFTHSLKQQKQHGYNAGLFCAQQTMIKRRRKDFISINCAGNRGKNNRRHSSCHFVHCPNSILLHL